MKKFRVSLQVDQDWVDNFDLVFEAEDYSDAEAQAFVQIKQNLGDYFHAVVDEEDELERIVNIQIDLNDDYEFELLREFFWEHGLFVEPLNSQHHDSWGNRIIDYKSFSLSIDTNYSLE